MTNTYKTQFPPRFHFLFCTSTDSHTQLAMKIFVTGPTGFIGRTTVDALLSSGYTVLGLARSQKAETSLGAKGVQVISGGLEDLDALRKGASESDGVLHLGFIHSYTGFKSSLEIDRNASAAMLDVLKGTNKPFINVTITQFLEEGHPAADEDSPYTKRTGYPFDRGLNEKAVLEYSTSGVRAMSVRVGTVHGKGDLGFIPYIVHVEKDHGSAIYIGKGDNVWTAVNVSDAASFFLLLLEKGRAGKTYNAVAENVSIKSIAETIGRKYGLQVKSVSEKEGAEVFGFLAPLTTDDNRVSSEKSKKELGWVVKGEGLLDDIRKYY
ncbi:DEKNAAC103368 [Brettanomyces naardenensis]|uniref:DEKNAAC103368 n=1 Tax=Brettanomyces naardenensis TaxID=13370 RepID=A0A448YNX0_BRENA|nr:DEKNAAC103368 [Brettanomyces naardenensis]